MKKNSCLELLNVFFGKMATYMEIMELLITVNVSFFLKVINSVADPDPNPDPDPPDPHVFGPPGSISQRYGSGSGSFDHHAKIVRKP
jgi:hypothetical protein